LQAAPLLDQHKKNNFRNAAILPDADRAVNMEYAGSTPFSTA
jgi:hypothetical protein